MQDCFSNLVIFINIERDFVNSLESDNILENYNLKNRTFIFKYKQNQI